MELAEAAVAVACRLAAVELTLWRSCKDPHTLVKQYMEHESHMVIRPHQIHENGGDKIQMISLIFYLGPLELERWGG
jgi:hypothetical protein